MGNREAVVPELPKCDICGQEAHYDARTKLGFWANLCDDCYEEVEKARESAVAKLKLLNGGEQ